MINLSITNNIARLPPDCRPCDSCGEPIYSEVTALQYTLTAFAGTCFETPLGNGEALSLCASCAPQLIERL